VATVPATAAAAPATATTVEATAAPASPASQLCLVDDAWTSLWGRSRVRDAGQADGRKTNRTGDCARTNNLLQDHGDPLLW
jgi:hypothetical protein